MAHSLPAVDRTIRNGPIAAANQPKREFSCSLVCSSLSAGTSISVERPVARKQLDVRKRGRKHSYDNEYVCVASFTAVSRRNVCWSIRLERRYTFVAAHASFLAPCYLCQS